MNSDKYQAMINASGGFTIHTKRGDRPQQLTRDDETALNKAWAKAQNTIKESPKPETEGENRKNLEILSF